jgi:hypothetical protein
MVTHSSPNRDPLAEKMTSEHVSKVLEISDKQELHDFQLRQQVQTQQLQIAKTLAYLVAFALAMCFALCWLFLYFGKSDLVSLIITALLAGGGGVGIGTGIKRLGKTNPNNQDMQK